MPMTILCHAADDAGFEGRFQLALDCARLTGGRLRCLQVDSLVVATFDPVGGINTAMALAENEEADRAFRDATETRLAGEGVSWEWILRRGDPASELAREGDLADLIVLSRGHDDSAAMPVLPLVSDVVMGGQTAVLAVPTAGLPAPLASGAAVIAWRDGPEAAHAVKAAAPLLAAIGDVHILEVCDTEMACGDAPARYLGAHGIEPALRRVESRAPADAIRQFAGERKATLVVAGAYGHSRLRETILGGVTRDLIRDCELPLLLMH